jgi:hypothetical protein
VISTRAGWTVNDLKESRRSGNGTHIDELTAVEGERTSELEVDNDAVL